MKKVIIYLIAGMALLSCTGFLEEKRTTSFSEDQIYDTEQALEANMYGCYLTMHNTALWKGTMSEYIHTASGLLIWGKERLTDEWLSAMYLTRYSNSIGGNENIWDALWTGINRCNRLIDNLPDSPVDEAYKLEIEAEARFIRAIMYYTAVRLWGDVPIIKTSPKVESQLYNSRQPWHQVYLFVLEDLYFAQTYMRSKERVDEVSFEKSRPCNWAATAMMSSVYLTIGSLLSSPDDNFWNTSIEERLPDFSGHKDIAGAGGAGLNTAEDAFVLAYMTAMSVINDGPYQLVSDYRTLFRWSEPGDWFLPEGIIMLTSSDKTGQNYNSVHQLPPFPAGTANFSTPNTNAGRVRPSRFQMENFIKYSGGRKGNSGKYNTKIYCATNDPRYNATYIVSYKRQDTGSSVTTYPNDNRITNTSGAYFRKYLDPTYDVTNGKADFYLMRLAEVYLIAAESAASLSSGVGDNWSNEAIRLVNVIRARAQRSVDAGVSTSPPDWQIEDFTSTEELINAVIWERTVELADEGHEWFDTHRRGATWLRDNIAVPANVFYMDNADMHSYRVTYYIGCENKGYIFPTDVQELRKSLLCAYPERELRLNTAPNCQNDYYWQ